MLKALLLSMGLLSSASALVVGSALRGGVTRTGSPVMAEITTGVSFDTVAREWRMKWTGDDDKASLAAAQVALNEVLPALKGLKGFKGVQRVVCGGCLDFKVITSVDGDAFGDWEGADFAPEEQFLTKVKAIDGITLVETQTFTLMPMD